MEKEAEDIEAEAVFLIGGALIRADQQTVLHLWVGQQHDLEYTDWNTVTLEKICLSSVKST